MTKLFVPIGTMPLNNVALSRERGKKMFFFNILIKDGDPEISPEDIEESLLAQPGDRPSEPRFLAPCRAAHGNRERRSMMSALPYRANSIAEREGTMPALT